MTRAKAPSKRRLREIAWKALDNEAIVILSTEEVKWLLGQCAAGRHALQDEQAE